MSKVLVKYHACWADEFDVDGFKVFEEEEWKATKKQVKEVFEDEDSPEEFYFGTNEAIAYDSYKHWKADTIVYQISETEAKVLEKYFGEGEYGTFIIPDKDE